MRYWLEIITPVRIVDAEVLTMIYFFPISKISDLNKLLPDILLNGDNLESFCNGINWVGKSMKSPVHLQVKVLNSLYIYTIYTNSIPPPVSFIFVADNKIFNIHFKEIRITIFIYCIK